MSNRNKNRTKKPNSDPLYQNHFESRSIKKIPAQYNTGKIHYPTEEELSEVVVLEETWKLGDRFYKYAKKYYNDESYWWLIAWINHCPTEHHFKVGDKVKIVASLSDARAMYFGE